MGLLRAPAFSVQRQFPVGGFSAFLKHLHGAAPWMLLARSGSADNETNSTGAAQHVTVECSHQILVVE